VSKDIRKLLIMNMISSIISIYIAIFVNLYIWESNHGIGGVSLYNLSMYICWGLSFTLASARPSKRTPLESGKQIVSILKIHVKKVGFQHRSLCFRCALFQNA
jgi:hypothetical protein